MVTLCRSRWDNVIATASIYSILTAKKLYQKIKASTLLSIFTLSKGWIFVWCNTLLSKIVCDGKIELGWPMKLLSIFPSCLLHKGCCWQAGNTSSNWSTTDLLLVGYTEFHTGFATIPCPTIPTARTETSGTGARAHMRGATTCTTPFLQHRVSVSTQHLGMVFFICSIVFSLGKNYNKTQ